METRGSTLARLVCGRRKLRKASRTGNTFVPCVDCGPWRAKARCDSSVCPVWGLQGVNIMLEVRLLAAYRLWISLHTYLPPLELEVTLYLSDLISYRPLARVQ